MDNTIYNAKIEKNAEAILEDNDILLVKLADDTVGTSGGTWYYVSNKNEEKKIALYKPVDYDEFDGAYMELIYAELAKMTLNDNVRIPEIKLVKDMSEKNSLGVLSYSVLDNQKEDLIHISEFIEPMYTEEEQSKFYTFGVDDILKAIKTIVNNQENYEEIERDIVQTVLLDSITNNADRHSKNWGLVRDKDSGKFELAIYDNVKSFINIAANRPGYNDSDLWSIGYVGRETSSKPSRGNTTVKFLKEKYPEYFNEFIDRFNNKKSNFYDEIKKLIGKIDVKRIMAFLDRKGRRIEQDRLEGFER